MAATPFKKLSITTIALSFLSWLLLAWALFAGESGESLRAMKSAQFAVICALLSTFAGLLTTILYPKLVRNWMGFVVSFGWLALFVLIFWLMT